MSKVPRPKPKRLPEKLKQIRQWLNVSQNELLKMLGIAEGYNRSVISGYELGTKEPPLPIILKYARIVAISTDVLIDDELEIKLQKKSND